jgi:hypothetical protein
VIENGNVSGSSHSIVSDSRGGSGIGTGYTYRADSVIGNLTIANGNVIGTSNSTSYGGSGIGTGNAYNVASNSTIGNLTIANGNVTGSAISTQNGGSGIGTGCTYNAGANSGIGNLTIANGNVTGTSWTGSSYGGSGIGTGSISSSGNSGIENLIIVNGNVTGRTASAASGGSAIGTGYGSAIANLRLLGNATLVCDSLRASSIFVWNASVFFFTQNTQLFQTTPDLSGRVRLTILYGSAASAPQEPSLVAFPYLSIGNISLPFQDGWRFCTSEGLCSEYASQTIRGLFALVPGAGNHSIIAEGAVSGFLGPSEEEDSFDVESAGSFFSRGYFNLITQPTQTLSASVTETASSSFCFTHWGKRISIRRSAFVAIARFLFMFELDSDWR